MISSTFFFLFSQLGVGMMSTLLFISPRSIGVKFFKFASTTAAALMAVTLGFEFLFPSPIRQSSLPVVFVLLAVVLCGAYNRTIHLEKYALALAFLIAATTAGMVGIILDCLYFDGLMGLSGLEGWVLVINHLGGTFLLGSVMLTMIFGHWYLVVPKLSLVPIRLLTRVYLGAIGFRSATIIVSLLILQWTQSISFANIADELFVRQAFLFWPRLILGLAVPSILGYMIWVTLRIGNTQAATGLLYLAVVAVLFGEFFSKFLLFSLSVPF